jgi:hypothetical protein
MCLPTIIKAQTNTEFVCLLQRYYSTKQKDDFCTSQVTFKAYNTISRQRLSKISLLINDYYINRASQGTNNDKYTEADLKQKEVIQLFRKLAIDIEGLDYHR